MEPRWLAGQESLLSAPTSYHTPAPKASQGKPGLEGSHPKTTRHTSIQRPFHSTVIILISRPALHFAELSPNSKCRTCWNCRVTAQGKSGQACLSHRNCSGGGLGASSRQTTQRYSPELLALFLPSVHPAPLAESLVHCNRGTWEPNKARSI